MIERSVPSKKVLSGVVAGWLGLTLLGVGCPAPPAPHPPQVGDHAEVWFGDLRDPIEIDAASAGATLAWVVAALDGGSGTLPAGWSADQDPRIVILSASDGTSPATVAVGRGRGMAAALDAAVVQLRTAGVVGARWLKLDVVGRVGPPIELRAGGQVGFDRSLEGVASVTPGLLVALPEQLVVHDLISDDATYDDEKTAEFLATRGQPGAAAEIRAGRGRLWVHRFTAASYFLAAGQLVELYRGHPVTTSASPDPLLAAARAGGDYLIGATAADGSFAYLYQSSRDQVDDDYNMVRHAGTVYAMLELWQETRDPALLAAIERAIGHLLAAVAEFGDPERGLSVMHYGGKIKLGGVALSVLALAKHLQLTGSRRYLEVAQRLSRYLAAQQQASGEFVHQRGFPGGEIRDFTSEYYPGEALFALVRMYQVDRDSRWLDVAERGADFLIEVRDRGLATDQLTHDHWLLYALAELYPERPRPRYLSHAMRIAEAIVAGQNLAPVRPDYLGTYGDPPRSAPVATRSEGLLAAYRLARDHRPSAAPDLLAAARLMVGFQLQTQIGPARALYLPRPARSLGGFTRSLSNFEVRIDYVQHNLSALLALRRALLDAAPSTAPPGQF